MAARILSSVDANLPVYSAPRRVQNSYGIGVHTGDFMGIPATGKHLVGRMTVWDRVVGGKIVSSDVFVDMAHLMIQMGVMEPPKLGPQ